MGALSWPVFSACWLCASEYISFSFVSIRFLVRDWDSRQWERPALLKMQDLSFCNDLCALASLCFGDADGSPSHLGRSWVCFRGWWHLGTNSCLFPEAIPSYCLANPPHSTFFFFFCLGPFPFFLSPSTLYSSISLAPSFFSFLSLWIILVLTPSAKTSYVSSNL